MAAGLIERIPFINAIRSAIGVLALAVTVVAALRDWTVSVAAQPASAHYSVGPSTSQANAIGTVDDGPGDVFSPEVRECASLLSVDLAKGGAAGSTASWQVVAGAEHAAPGDNQDTVVDAGRRTTFRLVMTREPEDVHSSSRIANGLVRLRVTVKRQDVEQVRKFIEGAITSNLPPSVYAALTGLFGDPLAKIAAMTDITGQGRLVAEYHLPEEPTLPPDPDLRPPRPPLPTCSARSTRTPSSGPPRIRDWASSPIWPSSCGDWRMRSVAPSFLLGDMDTHIAYARAVQREDWANLYALMRAVPGAAAKINSHCGVKRGPLREF